jgi:hypothetical protein
MRYQGCLLCCYLKQLDGPPARSCSSCGHSDTALYSDHQPTESELLEVSRSYLARIAYHPETLGTIAKFCLRQSQTIAQQKELISALIESQLSDE